MIVGRSVLSFLIMFINTVDFGRVNPARSIPHLPDPHFSVRATGTQDGTRDVPFAFTHASVSRKRGDGVFEELVVSRERVEGLFRGMDVVFEFGVEGERPLRGRG